MKRIAIALCLVLIPALALAAAGGGWKVVQRVPLGGAGFWDYLFAAARPSSPPRFPPTP